MSAFLDGVMLFAALLVAFGAFAVAYWVFEILAWQIEKRRRRREVLPNPEWRARVHRRWNVPL